MPAQELTFKQFLDLDKFAKWQEFLKANSISVSFEDFCKFYGVKAFDASPKTFEIEQTELLMSSLMSYGFQYDTKPIIISLSDDPSLSGHCVEGRHRFYSIFVLTVRYGLRIPGVMYGSRKLRGLEMPDLHFKTETVADFDDVRGLIVKYEILNRSKSERAREARIEDQIDGMIGDGLNYTLDAFREKCREHGVTDPMAVHIVYVKYLDEQRKASKDKEEAERKKRENQNKAASAGGGEWGPLGTGSSATPAKTLPTEVEWTSKRIKCPDGHEFAMLLRVKVNGKVVPSAEIDYKVADLTEAVSQ